MIGRITKLKLRNIRCFKGNQEARLGRITLLVGPNGAGKSTFLGCYKTFSKLANLDGLGDENHFDDEPFHMGSFKTVVRSRCEDFTLAGLFEGHCYTGAEFKFFAEKDEPRERKIRFDFDGQDGPEHLKITRLSDSREALRFEGPNFLFDLDRSEISYIQPSTWLSQSARHGHLPFGGDTATFRKRQHPAGRAPDQNVINFAKFVSFFRSELPLPDKPSFIVKVIDPALPQRQRFYDSVSSILPDSDDSEMRLFLTEIGKKLNLWNDVFYQENKGGGFEIMIGTQSGPRNLIDVGYGVHSILPLAHVMYGCPPGTIFLLQQPEVHLHPSAQANLAQLMVESEHDFLIETHSEHFMDRFRICVMKGQLSPEDLSIVYFEPGESGKSSTIYNLAVDANANLLKAPKSYKQFFMSETEKLLGFDNL